MSIWSVKHPPGFGVRQSSGAFSTRTSCDAKAPEGWRTPGRCRVPFTVFFSLLFTCMLHAQKFPDVSELPTRVKLPDPLVLQDGQRVKTEKDWFEKRRPELKALFQHYMYGQFPPVPKDLNFISAREDKTCFGGKATKREI